MKLSILLFALAFLAYAYGQCNSNGHYANRVCACYSGFSGDQCATDLLTPSGCSLSSVSPLTTESVAELLTTPPETRITNNDFIFTLVSPGRTNRYFDSIKLAGNDTCSYPVVPFTHTFNSETAQTYACNDVYVGQFSIPEVSACGFTQSSNADFTILSGSIDVIVKDDLGMFRSTAITRTTSSSLAVELKFPSHYTVSSGNLTVVSPIEVYAAVTFQEYDPMNDKLSLVITTSVQWPYVLSSPVLVSSPDASYVVSGPELNFLTCADYSGDCLQETIISFTNITAAGICSITDQVFPFDWNYGCRGDSKDCPVTGSNSVSQVDAHITTGELCSTLTVISGVTGTLTAYASSAFGQTSLAYLANAPVFLKAEINAQVTVQEVTVVDVIVRVGSNSYTIVSGGLSQINFGNLNFQTYTSGLLPNEVGLSFDATYAGDNAIFITSGESIFVFTVDVKVSITYTTSFKRDVVVENMVISKDLVLDASHA